MTGVFGTEIEPAPLEYFNTRAEKQAQMSRLFAREVAAAKLHREANTDAEREKALADLKNIHRQVALAEGLDPDVDAEEEEKLSGPLTLEPGCVG